MTTNDVTQEEGTSVDNRRAGSGVKKGPSRVTQTEVKATVLDLHGYRVGRSVGQGSYATVKEAYSQRHKCRVAIKIISKRKAPGDYLEKFLPREIDVVKLIKHPNLVVFLQSIETNNRVYLVMEYAPGGDLLEVVRQQKFIPEKQAGIWYGQMLDGIDYCHQKGVVHRDLKCENILLDEYQNLKITDFGFARCGMKPKVGGQFILSETYCGSYAYASPEILTGTPYAPQYADIWSMGVILYVMLVGRLPFDDSNHRRLLRQVNNGPVFPPSRGVSAECADLINKILVKMPNRPTLWIIRNHKWFKTHCQPVLDLMEKEANKHQPIRKESIVNANHNNANIGHPDCITRNDNSTLPGRLKHCDSLHLRKVQKTRTTGKLTVKPAIHRIPVLNGSSLMSNTQSDVSNNAEQDTANEGSKYECDTNLTREEPASESSSLVACRHLEPMNVGKYGAGLAIFKHYVYKVLPPIDRFFNRYGNNSKQKDG